MITVILTALTIFCLFYGILPLQALILLCCLSLPLYHRHGQGNRLVIDSLAQSSGLNCWNPMQKFVLAIVCMVLCISSKSPVTGLFLTLVMGLSTIYLGKLRFRDYLHLLTLPAAFLMFSGLALLFEYSSNPAGVIQIPFFHGYLCVTKLAQQHTGLILLKSSGAVSCLYFLSLSTPMHELIGVLNKLPFPKIMTELMYLIYRCIFILLSMYDSMKTAAESRLGFDGLKGSIKTSGKIYSNLLAKSYRQAMQMFDAMESRCYDGDIAFWSAPCPAPFRQSAFGICIFAGCILTLL